MSNWQPIATAPKDGRYILAYGLEDGIECYHVVCWDDETAPHYFWATLDGPSYHQALFTWWMPLPAAPVSEIEADG
jgi:hypothetical protein